MTIPTVLLILLAFAAAYIVVMQLCDRLLPSPPPNDHTAGSHDHQ